LILKAEPWNFSEWFTQAVSWRLVIKSGSGEALKFTYFYKYVNELQMDRQRTSKSCGIGTAQKEAGVGERR
jgi:hypothetical protein